MSGPLIADLGWLPRAPADFSTQCNALLHAEGSLGKRVRALASHALDDNKLNRLAKAIDAARARPAALEPLAPFKLGIVSNATTHFFVPALVATAARYGFLLECIEGGFDQALQEACDPLSGINQARPDAVLIAVDYRGLPLRCAPGDQAADGEAVAAALAHLAAIRRGFASHSATPHSDTPHGGTPHSATTHGDSTHGGTPCVLQTLARPVESAFGSLDPALAGTLRHLIDGFNRQLAAEAYRSSDLLLDVAGLAESVGLAEWHDPTLWNIAKVPFANKFLPIYAESVCRLIAAVRGKSRRCLVLDLDNTLWGGVIGDDGLPGIVLSQGDATGEAFLSVQRTALILRERGIVLAICSKNDDAVARAAFREHPEMLLREDHIAVFQANWEDKATNILAIAEALSLGLESLVFLDDNPAERARVRDALPEVAVPELPDDPALYARTLLAAGYFEAVAFSAEDRSRADAYRQNAQRVALKQTAGNMDDYLRSLAMTITFRPFDAAGRARIAQLINKSNQFNLTTQRYSEPEVARLEGDPGCFSLQVRLTDSFGDNGMICVVICLREADDWRIDTWLMSCRVLGRMVEQAVLQELVREAKQRGVRRLVGTYIPTERNRLVEQHYPRLGFELLERGAGGTTVWQLSVEAYVQRDLPLTIGQPVPQEAL
jgi:FkbH-like protein